MPNNPVKDAGRAALHVRRDLLALFDDLVGRGLIDRFTDEDVTYYDHASGHSCIIEAHFLCDPKSHDKMKEIRLAVFAFAERVADEFTLPVGTVKVETERGYARLWIHLGKN